jgi:hypothetical protein
VIFCRFRRKRQAPCSCCNRLICFPRLFTIFTCFSSHWSGRIHNVDNMLWFPHIESIMDIVVNPLVIHTLKLNMMLWCVSHVHWFYKIELTSMTGLGRSEAQYCSLYNLQCVYTCTAENILLQCGVSIFNSDFNAYNFSWKFNKKWHDNNET